MHPKTAHDIELSRFDNNDIVKLIGINIGTKMFDAAIRVEEKQDFTTNPPTVTRELKATDCVSKAAVSFAFQYMGVPYGCIRM